MVMSTMFITTETVGLLVLSDSTQQNWCDMSEITVFRRDKV